MTDLAMMSGHSCVAAKRGPYGCESEEDCQRKGARLEGFNDPRAAQSFIRWCHRCRRLYVVGKDHFSDAARSEDR